MVMLLASYILKLAVWFIVSIILAASIGALLRVLTYIGIPPFEKKSVFAELYNDIAKKYLRGRRNSLGVLVGAVGCLISNFGITVIIIVVWFIDTVIRLVSSNTIKTAMAKSNKSKAIHTACIVHRKEKRQHE